MRRAVALVVLTVAAPARADDAQAVPEDARLGPHAGELPTAPWFEADTWPRRLIWRPLVLDCHMLEARVSARAGTDVAVAPDLWFGVNRRLTVGVVHRGGVCVSGCDDRYRDVAAEARFHLRGDAAGVFAIQARDLDPATTSLALGAITRWRSGDVAVVAAPALQLGLTRRDLDNRERLSVPVTLQWQATGWLAFELGAGIAGPIDGFFGAPEASLRAGVTASPRRDLDVGLGTALPDAFASADGEATAWLAWRL